MRAPLLGQVAVFAALLALSTCLTGKELLLLSAVIHAQAAEGQQDCARLRSSSDDIHMMSCSCSVAAGTCSVCGPQSEVNSDSILIHPL